MASRKQVVRISTLSVEELQTLFDIDSTPPRVAYEFGSRVDLFNTFIIGLRILLDTALAGSQSAKNFLAELAGAQVDESMCDLYSQIWPKADSLCEATQNSEEAKRDLHSMLEQLFQGFDFRSAEYPGYVADFWES